MYRGKFRTSLAPLQPPLLHSQLTCDMMVSSLLTSSLLTPCQFQLLSQLATSLLASSQLTRNTESTSSLPDTATEALSEKPPQKESWLLLTLCRSLAQLLVLTTAQCSSLTAAQRCGGATAQRHRHSAAMHLCLCSAVSGLQSCCPVVGFQSRCCVASLLPRFLAAPRLST